MWRRWAVGDLHGRLERAQEAGRGRPDMTPAALLTYFAQAPDPRIERSRLHPPSSTLLMSLCAIVCGAQSFARFEEWATPTITSLAVPSC